MSKHSKQNDIIKEEQDVQHQFDLSFPGTIREIAIKIAITFMINIMVFYIFNPFFYHRPRQVYRTKDYLYILYMAIIGTIATIIIGIIYIFLRDYVVKYSRYKQNQEKLITYIFLIIVLIIFTIGSLYVYFEEQSRKKGWEYAKSEHNHKYDYI